MAAAPSSSCTWVFRSHGSQGHPREAVSWRGPVVAAPVCAGSSAVTAAALGCYQLLPLPAVSHGGLVVASSTVGTALPIPTPSHGAAGHSRKHLVKAACVSQPELVSMSTLKQCFARVPWSSPLPEASGPACTHLHLELGSHTPALLPLPSAQALERHPGSIHGEHGLSGRVLPAAQRGSGARLPREQSGSADGSARGKDGAKALLLLLTVAAVINGDQQEDPHMLVQCFLLPETPRAATNSPNPPLSLLPPTAPCAFLLPP